MTTTTPQKNPNQFNKTKKIIPQTNNNKKKRNQQNIGEKNYSENLKINTFCASNPEIKA